MTVIDDLPWAHRHRTRPDPQDGQDPLDHALQMLAGWFRQESAPRDDSGPGGHRRRRD
jgi:hypothetical protein